MVRASLVYSRRRRGEEPTLSSAMEAASITARRSTSVKKAGTEITQSTTVALTCGRIQGDTCSVPVQMWERCAQSRCRWGDDRDTPVRGADVTGGRGRARSRKDALPEDASLRPSCARDARCEIHACTVHERHGQVVSSGPCCVATSAQDLADICPKAASAHDPATSARPTPHLPKPQRHLPRL